MNGQLQHKILYSIIKDETSGCWLWRGQVSNSGHGRMMIKNDDNTTRMESARNVSYMAFVSDIPKGMLTRPICNNRLCVNPEHLQLFDPEISR
jgi:hypothetical protein